MCRCVLLGATRKNEHGTSAAAATSGDGSPSTGELCQWSACGHGRLGIYGRVHTRRDWLHNLKQDAEQIEDADKFVAVTAPFSGDTIGFCPVSKERDVDIAVKAAADAFETWGTRTMKDRAQIMIRFHGLIVTHRDELASLIVLEHGKTKTEALAEVDKGLETIEYAISLPQLTQGKIAEVSRGITCQDSRRPLGVVVSIVPFNFPFMVPMWTLPIVVGLGNTLIVKPSEKVPLTMNRVASLFRDAGFPPGVINIVHGAAGTARLLASHPTVAAVTFVGTSHVAELIHKQGRALNKRVLALGGAKNHLVASPDCKRDMTAQDVVNSFTGCTGQRCMAASVLLTIGPQPDLIAEIVKRANALAFSQDVGSGRMGPVIDAASVQRINAYVSESELQGAEILLDGRQAVPPPGGENGFWVAPSVVLHKKNSDKMLREEVFGPVLSILEVATKEEAIAFENANPYGNAACIYTNDPWTADWFTRHFSAGMLGVNIGVPVPREPFSFGGINRSRFGDSDITGEGAIQFFTWNKKVTTKWAVPVESNWMS
ncbi:aldehyde dehydrogenase domain-containing protein [Chytriomyces sp. MP71]|nr:aldehyde dehydrogenase domain-containing protein [Chytriomyces sp. MP71]